MAYKGKRDPEVDIVIRQSLCEKYKGKDGMNWIEIFIPRREGSAYPWGTIMVKPEQVYYIDDVFNLVRVNNFAKIVNSTKEKDTRKVLDSEEMTPDIIIGQIIRYETGKSVTPEDAFKEFEKTGLTLYNYIRLITGMQTHAPQPGVPMQPDV